MSSKLRLYHYWQSSCSWRVRWALAIKKVPVELVHMDLFSAELKSDNYLRRNPMGMIPTLEILDNSSIPIGESMAILDWLENEFPEPPLRPANSILRAHTLQLCEIINAGTQPLQNIRVAKTHSDDPSAQLQWNQHWISYGLSAYERLASRTAGQFSIGDQLTWADLLLIPQVYNARVRYRMEVDRWPTIARICATVQSRSECFATAPEQYLPIKGAP